MSPPKPDPQTERAERFNREHARSLRALAYRMLGSRAEAEDIVQEAWLRWAEVDTAQVRHDAAFLSRLVTNLCLDRLGSAASRREHYVGVWLPEPLIDSVSGIALSLGGREAAALEALGLTVSLDAPVLAQVDETLQARTGLTAGTPIRAL